MLAQLIVSCVWIAGFAAGVYLCGDKRRAFRLVVGAVFWLLGAIAETISGRPIALRVTKQMDELTTRVAWIDSDSARRTRVRAWVDGQCSVSEYEPDGQLEDFDCYVVEAAHPRVNYAKLIADLRQRGSDAPVLRRSLGSHRNQQKPRLFRPGARWLISVTDVRSAGTVRVRIPCGSPALGVP